VIVNKVGRLLLSRMSEIDLCVTSPPRPIMNAFVALAKLLFAKSCHPPSSSSSSSPAGGLIDPASETALLQSRCPFSPAFYRWWVSFPSQVGPFNNPSETYQYYSLPFCKEGTGGKSRRQRHDLGEILVGDRKVGRRVTASSSGDQCRAGIKRKAGYPLLLDSRVAWMNLQKGEMLIRVARPRATPYVCGQGGGAPRQGRHGSQPLKKKLGSRRPSGRLRAARGHSPTQAYSGLYQKTVSSISSARTVV
jgi:hypothetical protein